MDYRKKRYLTAFIGHFPDAIALNNYIRISYEDDNPTSQFQEDFKLGDYEPELREVEFFEDARTIASEFLKGASYSKSFIASFEPKYDAVKEQSPNCVILIYDLDYANESRKDILEGKACLQGLGAFGYDISSPPL